MNVSDITIKPENKKHNKTVLRLLSLGNPDAYIDNKTSRYAAWIIRHCGRLEAGLFPCTLWG